MELFSEDGDFDSPSYACERFSSQIEEILWVMGRPEASVTNDTTFGDFYYDEDEDEWEDFQEKFAGEFGFNVDIDDFTWEIAKKIYERDL